MDKKIKDLELEIQSLKRACLFNTITLLIFFIYFIITKYNIWNAIVDINSNVNEIIKISGDLVDILTKLSNLFSNYFR